MVKGIVSVDNDNQSQLPVTERLRHRGAATFSSLRIRNYRLFFIGQSISLPGTAMQTIALSWLVLELTHSGTMIGLVLAAQFLPVSLFAAYGGVVADRVSKRPLIIVTQSIYGLLALTLGLLVLSHVVETWIVFVFAACLGLVASIDNPTRQSFMMEMVGGEHVQNAVSLNSVLVNGARSVGPAIAGALIATVGVGICFLINAGSFIAAITALSLIRSRELTRSKPIEREPGQLREGLRYVRARSDLLVPLVIMALVGTLAYEFPVLLPLVAHDTLHSGAETFGLLTTAMGVGAVSGGLVIAGLGWSGVQRLTVAALAFGVAILLTAIAPTFSVMVVTLFFVGAASIAFISTGNSTLQLASTPRFRGRVMALWAITFVGTTPIGGPLVGAISEVRNPRYGLAVGGLACLVAATVGAITLRSGSGPAPTTTLCSDGEAVPTSLTGDLTDTL
jgi:MFS family permease